MYAPTRINKWVALANGPGQPLDRFPAAQAGFSTGSPPHLLSPSPCTRDISASMHVKWIFKFNALPKRLIRVTAPQKPWVYSFLLIQNVADPSPNWGWRNRERSDLQSLSRPDQVLCLALIHHLVITANIPLEEFIGWLAGLTDKLIIEYASRNDDKVKTLLRNKEDRYQDYSGESLETNLKKHFEIRQKTKVNNGDRFLYLSVKPKFTGV